MPQTHDAIAVVDFGGQYAHLIATKVREHRVRADILQPEDPIDRFAGYSGVILSGSPSLSAHDEDGDYTKALYELPVPILGFCFGHQEMAKHYGGRVIHGGQEWGHTKLVLTGEHPLFAGQPQEQVVWMSHFDSVEALGAGFREGGYTVADDGAIHHNAVILDDQRRRYGFQFHPEVDDTQFGDQMIRNFVLEICGCRPSWTMARYKDEQIAAIRQAVGDRSVFLLVSGGVDSTVAAALFGAALPAGRLRLLHVDTGLMRKNESRQVIDALSELGLGEALHFVDASQTFLRALSGVTDPETKRAIIGKTFVDVFTAQAAELGISDHLLGQGTIYPDTIESGGSKRSHTIKTHHNRVAVIEEMIAAGKVIEPLVELYKVEVRQLGEALGLSHDLVWRHPFPGPGLGVRLLCTPAPDDQTQADADSLSGEAAIANQFGLQAQVLPVRSVGVKADIRSYEHPVMLSGTSDWQRLQAASSLIFKTVRGINRSIWCIAPPKTSAVRARAAGVTALRLDRLREADQIVTDALRRHRLYEKIWQCPTVFVPLSVGDQGEELCVVRPVLSERAMTAKAAELPPAVAEELGHQLSEVPGVGIVAIDLTSKPPGTIEWE